jgi:glutathione peroxidase
MHWIVFAAIVSGLAGSATAAPPAGDTRQPEGACPPLLERSFSSLMDETVSLCQFKGKVVLIVNTASQCGFTPQYEGLEALYRRYKDRGLVVLGFPANDFGGQEPGSSKDIARFCQVNYGVSFPMFAKTAVVGPDANPLYRDLAAQSGKPPRWNFHKYLVDRNGAVVASFDSAISPRDARVTTQIERLLAAR